MGKNSFTFPFPTWVYFILFSWLITLARTSSIMLNRSCESENLCLVLDRSIFVPDMATHPPFQTGHKIKHSTFLMQRLPPHAKLVTPAKSRLIYLMVREDISQTRNCPRAPGRLTASNLCPLAELLVGPHHYWHIFKLWNCYSRPINQLQSQQYSPRN